MVDPHAYSLGFTAGELASVDLGAINRPSRSWLEAFTGQAVPPRRGPAEQLPPIRAGAVRFLADAGTNILHVEIAPGLHLVGEIPDYYTTSRMPGLDPVTIGAAIGGAASEVVTGIGDWIADFFPKAQQVRAEGDARAAVVLAEGDTAIQAAANAAAVDAAKTQAKLDRIRARAAARLAETYGYPQPGYPPAYGYSAPYPLGPPYPVVGYPPAPSPLGYPPAPAPTPAPTVATSVVAVTAPAPRRAFPDLSALGGLIGEIVGGGKTRGYSDFTVTNLTEKACCSACAKSGGRCGGGR